MSVVVATSRIGVFIAPIAAVDFLFVGEIVINREAPIGLPGRKNANERVGIIAETW